MIPNADSVDAQAVEALLHLRIWDEGFGRSDVTPLQRSNL
jgi:hypothetical protein